MILKYLRLLLNYTIDLADSCYWHFHRSPNVVSWFQSDCDAFPGLAGPCCETIFWLAIVILAQRRWRYFQLARKRKKKNVDGGRARVGKQEAYSIKNSPTRGSIINFSGTKETIWLIFLPRLHFLLKCASFFQISSRQRV